MTIFRLVVPSGRPEAILCVRRALSECSSWLTRDRGLRESRLIEGSHRGIESDVARVLRSMIAFRRSGLSVSRRDVSRSANGVLVRLAVRGLPRQIARRSARPRVRRQVGGESDSVPCRHSSQAIVRRNILARMEGISGLGRSLDSRRVGGAARGLAAADAGRHVRPRAAMALGFGDRRIAARRDARASARIAWDSMASERESADGIIGRRTCRFPMGRCSMRSSIS